MDRPDVWQYPPVDASRRSIAVWESVGRGMAAGIITGVVTGGTVLAGIIVTETAASWLQALLLYTMAAGLLGAPLGGVSGVLAWALSVHGVLAAGLRAAGAGVAMFWALWVMLLLGGRGIWGLPVAAGLGALWAVWVAVPGPRRGALR